jgi:TIR domain
MKRPTDDHPRLKVALGSTVEDQRIAAAVASMLTKAFPDALDIVILNDLRPEENWLKRVGDYLETADILIPIITDLTRATFTGFEIGAFVASLQSKRNTGVDPHSERRLVPIVVSSEVPEILRQYSVLSLELNRDGDGDTPVRSKEKIVELLRSLQPLAEKSPYARVYNDLQLYEMLASRLCDEILQDISGRIKAVTTPATLVISLPFGWRMGSNLSSATVRALGYCYDAFHVDQDDRILAWDHFLSNALEQKTAVAWEGAFKSLIMSDFLGSETIPSFDGHKVFRLFVSRRVSLFSGVEEYYVYVVPERQITPVSVAEIGVNKNATADTARLSPSPRGRGTGAGNDSSGLRKPARRTRLSPGPLRADVQSDTGAAREPEGTERLSAGPSDRGAVSDTGAADKRSVNVFISYKHVDPEILDRVRDQLGWLEQNDSVRIFDDRSIAAGEDWNARILNELEQADIIILLVSAAFMRSAYCTRIELRKALNARSERGAVVVPVIMETSDWEAMPIRSIAALPKDKSNNLKPLNKWGRDTDVALTQVAKSVRAYVEARLQIVS